MVRCVVILLTLAVFCQARNVNISPGPQFPPTKGEVWPKAQDEKKQKTVYLVEKYKLEFKMTQKSCQILTDAIERAKKALQKFPIIADSHEDRSNLQAKSALSTVNVELTQPCENYPYYGMDESYNLTVSATATLRSASIWGVLHGLESFLHLLYLSDDYKTLLIRATEIQDYPRHPHRGLLLDTSRHYLSVANLLITLDALAMNKFNVFHWHIVDDTSFPYQSEKFPELSERGAYHPSMVYTKADIKRIVEYARVRGIRVIPEIDVPGHVRSWGEAYPQILTECYSGNKVTSLGPLNPINNQTYKLLGQLLEEVRQWFPDKYLHLGGDEVDASCWSSNPSLLEYMQNHNMSSINQFNTLFMERTKPLVGDRKIIVWEEVFNEKVPISDDTLVQIWSDSKTEYQVKRINQVVNAGKSALFSNDWYLSMLNNGGDWEKFYISDPRKLVTNKTLVHKVVGGEACMWGEFVDDRNFLQRVWPRASAIGERLWSEAARDRSDQYSAEPRDHVASGVEDQPYSAEPRGHVASGLEDQTYSTEPIRHVASRLHDQSYNLETKGHMASRLEDQPYSAEPRGHVASWLEDQSYSAEPRGHVASRLEDQSYSAEPRGHVASRLEDQSYSAEPRGHVASRLEDQSYSAEPRGHVASRLEDQSYSAEPRGHVASGLEDQLYSAEPRGHGAKRLEDQSHSAESIGHVARRLEEHACRMLRRGVPAQPPNGPGFCIF